MEFVDTHCHLNFHTYKPDLDQVIARAVMTGVNHIVVPGLDLTSSRDAVDLADRYESVYAAVGVHPEEVENFNDNQLSSFEDLLTCKKVMAVGEIGLDYYHRQDRKTLQHEILKTFLELAIVHHKPVIMHSRESLKDLLIILDEVLTSHNSKGFTGIFHAFEGDPAEAKVATAKGFYIGAGGPITYKKALTKHAVFSKIPLSNIVLETDGPFLTPQFHRGKRNEPSYIPLIAQRLAEIQQCDIKEVAECTTANAHNLFNWN